MSSIFDHGDYGHVTFPPCNNFLYGQDFAIHRGIPSGFPFTISALWNDGTDFWLQAPGYGGSPYGNGQLYVYGPTAEWVRDHGVPKGEA